MAADIRRAANVCATCKARKKRCDKALPHCRYCTDRGLACRYQTSNRTLRHQLRPTVASEIAHPTGSPKTASRSASGAQSGISVAAASRGLSNNLASSPHFPTPRRSLAPVPTAQPTLFVQAQHLLETTGWYLDEISVCYFQGNHTFVPIVCRRRFHAHLLSFGKDPKADFALLLLCMGLLTSGYSADSDSRDPPASRRMEDNTLYIAIKSLMSQAQVLCTPSIRLVQAGVLLAVFEYAHGHPQQAFMTIGTCARMAYAARLRSIPSLTSTASTTDWVAEEEEVNVWWGICVCERTFLCELPIVHQPLGSMVPTGEERLPLESSILDQGNPAAALKSSPVHALVTPQVGGFARAAQAAWLLDGVLHALSLTDPDQQQAHLADCDRKLQSLLAIVMQQNEGKYGEFCPAIALILRSLFLLHGHLLDQQPQYAPGASISTNSSLAALDTVTKMVIDICTTHEHVPISQIDHLPPSCLYIIRAALKHISEYHSATPDPRLHSSLKQFEARWGTSSR